MTESVPTTQKAAVYTEHKGEIKIQEIPVPQPKSDELLVKLMFSGICRSDIQHYYGDYSHVELKSPLIGGHEGSGIVAKLGSHVTDFKLGDKVGIKFLAACLSCEFCKRGYESNCTSAIWFGFRVDGTFQQYAVVKANAAIRIPDELDLAQAAPILCAGLTAYRAVLETNTLAGEFVTITGAAGGLGSLAIQYARAMGLRVIGIDAGANKEEACRQLGAEFFIDVLSEKNVLEKVLEITNGGTHAVINMATSLEAIQTSLLYVRPRGTVVIVSLPPGNLEVNLFSTVMKTITIKGSLVGTRQDTDAALGFVVRGQVKSPIEIVKLEQLKETFERIAKSQVVGRVVIDLWK
ncbi:hypothetical protein M3Y94_00264500 [Aphelenchoides besseyi]|nr:hypothetical protein M3Y94_00264500 [Aphelenchoides besseyi]KAI6236143.1 alcohol dehydrogenase [Aphelenchoides besseyi]